MESTPPSGHWLDWFSETPSSSRPTAQRSPQHSSTSSDQPALQSRRHSSNNSLPRYTPDRPHHVDHGLPPPPPPPPGQHGTIRSRWRWSTWSAPNNLFTTARRRNNRSNPAPAMVEHRHRHSWMDQHKRRTYPPRAMRVLKQEQRRFTQGKSGKKSRLLRLLGTYNSSKNSLNGDTDKKLRDAFFQQPRRRRHSLTGVLTSFVHSTSSLSTPPTLSSSNTNGSPQNRASGLGSSSSSSSSPRPAGHPFSSQRTPSSSRKSAKVTPPTVRSSMVLHYTDDDDDSASLHLPDVVYQGHENSRSTLGSTSGGGKSISSRRRQKQPLSRSEGHRWFSHWIPHHPRHQRRRRRRRTHSHDIKQRHTPMAMNTNGSSTKIHPSPQSTTNTTTSSTDSDEKKTRLKTTLPLLHHATLSDLSSLSSTPSHPFSNKAPTTAPPPSLSAYRFSVFWKSSEGKSGKRVIHVDERGHAGHATLCSRWNTCNHTTSGNLLATFFIAGFLVCPFWWVGAALYLYKASAFAEDLSAVSLWTPRTFGHLNCWMSVVSFLLLGFLAALAIWYHLDVV
ncbi:hypothetical protein [Absidia glauca]|uniref:Uncharacterized protein n=1 Tax=Absidia glauca TaxID=4829 RepID=A0A168L1B9_ABSGL|nr:hypothetical protein [Absidia glauca]